MHTEKSYPNPPRYEKHDAQYMNRRKIDLIKECKSLANRCTNKMNGSNTLNIAVIGEPGCGKSAFLNTIFTSLSTTHWSDIAKSGQFESDDQFSVYLKRYKKKDYYIKEDDTLLPTFIDMTGFDDCEADQTKEILRIILSGKIKDNELLAKMKKSSINKLRLKSFLGWPCSSKNRIRRIIVVSSSDPDVNLPRSLFSSINQVAKERDIPVYGVLTKADRHTFELCNKVQEKEEAFMKCLGLEQNRFCRIANYCPDVDPSMSYTEAANPSLDVPVLTFLKQVLTPDLRDSVEDQPGNLACCASWTLWCIYLVVLAAIIVMILEKRIYASISEFWFGGRS